MHDGKNGGGLLTLLELALGFEGQHSEALRVDGVTSAEVALDLEVIPG